MQLCNGLLRRHHHLQQVRKTTLRRNIHLTKSSRTQTQTKKMRFLEKAHTVPRTPNLCRQNSTPTRKTRKHSQDASIQKPKRSETVPWPSRLLQKICSQIHRHLKSTNTSNKEGRRIQVDPRMWKFQILKEFLQQAPILKYPDPEANYTLYTDASKYTYTGILTQHNNGTDHPIT